jgi:predicted dehydrogenase
MTNPLRVGVIGLGRRWRKRYRPALRALHDRFRVHALYDQVQQRALLEAQRLHCDAAAGLTELFERDDLDAVMLIDAQWFGLWPLELACRVGKPVFCCTGLDRDDVHADAIYQQVQASQLPVMVEMAPRQAPATARVRELLHTELGAARLVVCESVRPAREPRRQLLGQKPGFASVGIPLVDWCVSLLGAEPLRAQADGVDTLGFARLLLEFPEGRTAQLTRWTAPHTRRSLRLRLVAERGSASIVPPGRVEWSGACGRHTHTLRCRQPLGPALLEQFHRAVTERQPPQPSLGDAYRALRWLRAASR